MSTVAPGRRIQVIVDHLMQAAVLLNADAASAPGLQRLADAECELWLLRYALAPKVARQRREKK